VETPLTIVKSYQATRLLIVIGRVWIGSLRVVEVPQTVEENLATLVADRQVTTAERERERAHAREREREQTRGIVWVSKLDHVVHAHIDDVFKVGSKHKQDTRTHTHTHTHSDR
jgi:hypothetical protein